MNLFNRLIKRGLKKEDPLKNAPAFRQMMLDLEREENEFIERLEKILPVVTFKSCTDVDIHSPEGSGKGTSESSQPVAFPINFDDDLSVNLTTDNKKGEMLLNRHIEVAKDKVTPDKLVSKAFGNLFKQIEDSISISMITEDMGMLTGCNGLESSLVLINEVWDLIRGSVDGDEIVFGIPASDIFVFASAESGESVGQVDVKVKEFYNDQAHPRKISKRLYVMHNDGKSEIFRE